MEFDATDFFNEYQKLKTDENRKQKITINTLMMKVFVEAIKVCPCINAHIKYSTHLVRGKIDYIKNINISLPMIIDDKMMTVNLRNFDEKNLEEMAEYISELARKLKNTDLNEAMYEVAFNDTIQKLKQGRIINALLKLYGSKIGKYKVRLLKGEEKKAYYSIPESDRLTKKDLEQGTVTITNIGSVFKSDIESFATLLEIIPPQIFAIAIGYMYDKPRVITDENGEKQVAVRKVLPISFDFDHRALDFGEIVPFCKKLDEIFKNPGMMHGW